MKAEMVRRRELTFTTEEGDIYRKCVKVVVDDTELGPVATGFLAYVIYFDPMGRRRRPRRKDPFLVTQAQLDEARLWALGQCSRVQLEIPF